MTPPDSHGIPADTCIDEELVVVRGVSCVVSVEHGALHLDNVLSRVWPEMPVELTCVVVPVVYGVYVEFDSSLAPVGSTGRRDVVPVDSVSWVDVAPVRPRERDDATRCDL